MIIVVETETLSDTLIKVKAKGIVVALFDTPAEEPETLSEHWPM